jgi:hypothetical protein
MNKSGFVHTSQWQASAEAQAAEGSARPCASCSLKRVVWALCHWVRSFLIKKIIWPPQSVVHKHKVTPIR